MQVSKKSLVRFLELLLLQGQLENNQVILNISPTTIKGLSASSGNISAVNAEIKNTYEDIGDIGINDIKKLIGFLNTFDVDEIDIKKDDNHLLLTSNQLKISYILEKTDYITNNITQEKFNSFLDKADGNRFIITKNIIEKITDYINSLNADNLYLKSENNVLELYTEANENSILATFDIKEKIKNFDIRVGRNLLDIFNRIYDDVQISIKNNSPVGIFYEKDNLKVSYVLAQWKKE